MTFIHNLCTLNEKTVLENKNLLTISSTFFFSLFSKINWENYQLTFCFKFMQLRHWHRQNLIILSSPHILDSQISTKNHNKKSRRLSSPPFLKQQLQKQQKKQTHIHTHIPKYLSLCIRTGEKLNHKVRRLMNKKTFRQTFRHNKNQKKNTYI